MGGTNPPAPASISLVTSPPSGYNDGSFEYAGGAVGNADGSGCSGGGSLG